MGVFVSCDDCHGVSRSINMPVQMQIVRIEPGSAAQGRDIRDSQQAVTELDQALATHLLDRTIDVNVREAKEIANLVLSQREWKGDVVLTLDPEADRDLAEQMGYPRMR